MASFNRSSANHSFAQKHIIDKAFQNLLEESIRYEHPSIMRKFHETSTLNLSSVRADLFNSMKSRKNPQTWRKDLKEKCKNAEKMNNSRMSQSSSRPFLSPTRLTRDEKVSKQIKKKFVEDEVSKSYQRKSPKKRLRSSVRETSESQSSTWKYPRLEESSLPSTYNKLAIKKSYKSSQGGDKTTEPIMNDKKKKMETNSRNNYVFDQWIFRFDENDNIFVKGHLSGSPPTVFWSTSEIIKRINNTTLLTASGKLCILEGPLMQNAMISRGYSVELIKCFLNGFPPEWEELLKEKDKEVPPVVTQQKRPQTANKVVEKYPRMNMKHREIKIEEEDDDEDEEEEEEDMETEGSEKLEKIIPLSTIQKNAGEAYLFSVLSHNAKPRLNKIPKKKDSTKVVSSSSNQIRTRSMVRLLNSKVQSEPIPPSKSATPPKLKVNNRKTIPKTTVSAKQVKKEAVEENFSGVAKKPALKKTHVTNKKNSRKSSQRKQPEAQQASLKGEKQRPQSPKVKKPPRRKKQTKDEKEPNKPTISNKGASSKKNPKRKEKKEWTEKEVHKLLTTMNIVPKTDTDFWEKVAAEVGRSAKECADYYCHCDVSNFNWKALKVKDVKEGTPKGKKKMPRIYDLSDSYDDMFDLDNFLGKKKKIHLKPEDGNLDSVFSDLSVKTPSSMSDPAFQTPLAKFFLTPVSECQTPASTFSDGDIKIDWDNADRCVKRFKNKQNKGAGRIQILQKNTKLKTEIKPKTLQLETLVGELNKMNNIPEKSDEADDSNLYFSSDTED